MTERDNPPLCFGAATDVGRVRQSNEDAWCADPRQGLFVVSDGMGGQQAGELAARMVVDVLPELLCARLARLFRPRARALRYWLRQSVEELSRGVCQTAQTHPRLHGMGATVVLALIRQHRAHLAHLGDSRAYLRRHDMLLPLTDDHSVVGMLLRAGLISPAEALVHPARSGITRFVGMEAPACPAVRTLELLAGDRLLLCTDGLNGMIGDEQIDRLLRQCPQPQEACEALVSAANDAGGGDNVTAMVIDWHGGPEGSQPAGGGA